jgi:hypothetical protein
MRQHVRCGLCFGGKRANTTTRLEHSALDGFDKRDDSR